MVIHKFDSSIESRTETLFSELYGDVASLKGKLVILSEEMGLKVMPFLQTKKSKKRYLARLESDYEGISCYQVCLGI